MQTMKVFPFALKKTIPTPLGCLLQISYACIQYILYSEIIS